MKEVFVDQSLRNVSPIVQVECLALKEKILLEVFKSAPKFFRHTIFSER
jgi:hypothetical protein